MNNELQYIKFKLGKGVFAFPITIVHKIIPLSVLTRVPYTAPYFVGITNLRGEILSIVDLKKFLSLEDDNSPKELISVKNKKNSQRIIITNQDGKLLGFLVDKVYGVETVLKDELKLPPSDLSDKIVDYVEFIYGEGDEFMIILDFNSIISNSKFTV